MSFDTRIFEGYSFEFVKNIGHLIGVKDGDSGGKSVSRCDPAGAKGTKAKNATSCDNAFVTNILLA